MQINNSASLGATAVLVYNNLEGGNTREEMTGLPVTIPAGFLARQDGFDLQPHVGSQVMVASSMDAVTILDPYR